MGDRSAGTGRRMIGELLGDLLAGLLTPSVHREGRAVRRARRKLAAGEDVVLPGLLLRRDAPALDGFLRVRPPLLWWRPGETSAYGEVSIPGPPDRVRSRPPHPAERTCGVPDHWTVLVLTTGDHRSALAVPEPYGPLLVATLRPDP